MRIIDADALGVGRCSLYILPAAYCEGWNGLLELIEKAPTIDAVPVVRCKDCARCVTHKGVPICNKWRTFPEVELDGFCSYGERKEGADNES